ncbi:hypothetical protein HZA26_03485 [Candidatus Nomurabacteria bacterium]|nr:hypothetical protein [Candidatus Nomurabacteria bacterium]
MVDLDPQANATQGMGINLEAVKYSVADLIRDRSLSTELALHQGDRYFSNLPGLPMQLFLMVEYALLSIT